MTEKVKEGEAETEVVLTESAAEEVGESGRRVQEGNGDDQEPDATNPPEQEAQIVDHHEPTDVV